VNVYEHMFRSISGASMPLDRWRGQPLLLVNTASKCVYTPQLAKLQAVYQEYRQSNLVVLGMPCNDFDGQEPADAHEIAFFYWDHYRVSFPLTEKISVVGLGAHPLFRAMIDYYGQEVAPRSNFTKYLFDGKGQLVEHWPAALEPDDPTVTHQIERQLTSWVF